MLDLFSSGISMSFFPLHFKQTIISQSLLFKITGARGTELPPAHLNLTCSCPYVNHKLIVSPLYMLLLPREYRVDTWSSHYNVWFVKWQNRGMKYDLILSIKKQGSEKQYTPLLLYPYLNPFVIGICFVTVIHSCDKTELHKVSNGKCMKHIQ